MLWSVPRCSRLSKQGLGREDCSKQSLPREAQLQWGTDVWIPPKDHKNLMGSQFTPGPGSIPQRQERCPWPRTRLEQPLQDGSKGRGHLEHWSYSHSVFLPLPIPKPAMEGWRTCELLEQCWGSHCGHGPAANSGVFSLVVVRASRAKAASFPLRFMTKESTDMRLLILNQRVYFLWCKRKLKVTSKGKTYMVFHSWVRAFLRSFLMLLLNDCGGNRNGELLKFHSKVVYPGTRGVVANEHKQHWWPWALHLFAMTSGQNCFFFISDLQ